MQKKRVHEAEMAQLDMEANAIQTRLVQLHERWSREQLEHERRRREDEEEDHRQDEDRKRKRKDEDEKHRKQEQKRREDEARAREEDRRREKEERDKLRLFWDEPQRHSRCAAFGKREYTATLQNLAPGYDWYLACTETAIEINGRVLQSPNRCEHVSDV